MERPFEMKISACITAGNEEEKIAACLKSLSWCDEVIVVDSFSKDRTVEIAKRYATRVEQHEWGGYIAQKNYIRQLAKYPWIFFVDADEVVSDGLRKEIEEMFEKGVGDTAGFQMPRMVWYLGKWIRHGEWYPDLKMRLFRKDRGYSAGEEPHDRVVVDGPVHTFRNPLYHFTYDNMVDHLNTLNRFSTISAQQKAKHGKRVGLTALLFRPWWRFFRGYVLQRGFLDGMAGLIVACLSGYGVFIKYAKLYEISRAEKTGTGMPDARG